MYLQKTKKRLNEYNRTKYNEKQKGKDRNPYLFSSLENKNFINTFFYNKFKFLNIIPTIKPIKADNIINNIVLIFFLNINL